MHHEYTDDRPCPACGGVGEGFSVGGEWDEAWWDTCEDCDGSGIRRLYPCDMEDDREDPA